MKYVSCSTALMFNRVRLDRQNEYGLTTLELRGPDSELQLRFLLKGDKRTRRSCVRSFLVQIRPWLRYFHEPIIDHSRRGLIRERPVGRSGINIFKSNSLSELSGAVGYEIRRKRIELGLSQETLARKIEIQRSHLSDIERGIHLPSRKTREKIARELKIALI